MKKIVILFISVLFVYASSDINTTSVASILKTISKNSPEYSLDLLYANKIKTIIYKKDDFNVTSIKNSSLYLKAFKKLAVYENFILNSSNHFNELNKKIDFLFSQTGATQKLEYLYYEKLITISKQKYDYLRGQIENWKKALYNKIFNTYFNTKIANSNIKYFQTKIDLEGKNLEKLKIDLEKWKIAGNSKNVAYIQNSIKAILQNKNRNYKNLADNYLILFLQKIKDKDKSAFKGEEKILKYIRLYNKKDENSYKIILNYFEKSRFGNTQLILNKTSQEAKLAILKTWSILNHPLFSVEKKDISLINFLIFIFLLILGTFAGKYYKKSVLSLKGKYDITNSTITLITNIGYYLILIISFLLALKSMGLDLSSFTLIAGALSVGIGFGLQNIVSNFVSGIILMFEKSIKIGDYIQIDTETRGTVIDIRMRSITIRTNDNIDLIVPNQNFIQNIVTNWTLNDNSRRFRIPFGVSYGTRVEEIEKVILGALKLSKLSHYKIGKKKPSVVFTSLGNSSINFELFVWVKDDLTLRPRHTTSECLKLIYKALNDANINIPFPQQDIYIKELPTTKNATNTSDTKKDSQP